MQLLSKCLTYEIIDVKGVLSSEKENEWPFIFAFWHNNILALGSGYRIVNPDMKMACLTSASKDGTIIQGAMQVYGVQSIRGSASRRGKTAMIEMMRALKEGISLSITPDGPRGPVHVLNPGMIRLASKTGVGIVPAQVEYSRFHELSTWDRFKIPLPFSRVKVYLGEPVFIPSQLTDEEVEIFRSQIEETLISSIEYSIGEAYAEYRW